MIVLELVLGKGAERNGWEQLGTAVCEGANGCLLMTRGDKALSWLTTAVMVEFPDYM